MFKSIFIIIALSLFNIKYVSSAPVQISLSEYDVFATAGSVIIEDFESFTPFYPFTHSSSQLELSNGTYYGSDPVFVGGPAIIEEPDGNQYLWDNGFDETQMFGALPTDTYIWSTDIKWASSPDSGASIQFSVTGNSGTSIFYVNPDVGLNLFAGFYDTEGLISVSVSEQPGFFDGSYAWVGHEIDNVTTVSAVPIPAAFWLFGSGLIGLIRFARR